MNFAVTGVKIGTKQVQYKKVYQIKPQTIARPARVLTKPIRNSVQIKPQPEKKVDQKPKMVVQQQKSQKQQEVISEIVPSETNTTIIAIELKDQPISKPTEAKQPKIGQVTIRYNHYKEIFSTLNDILSFRPIQEKYSFGDLFLGDYKPVLKKYKQQSGQEPLTIGTAVDYSWLVEDNQVYTLEIQEDEQAESKRQKVIYRAPKEAEKCPLKKNIRIEELTSQMKKMGLNQLGSAQHRQLLEQRDLEDILYS